MDQAKFADFRIALFGPPGSGKTETIRQLGTMAGSSTKVRPVFLHSRSGATLLYDYFFLDLGAIDETRVRLHFYGVPGRARYVLAARMILHAADAVIFVVDGRDSRLPETLAHLKRLDMILGEVGLDLETFPKVFQINKADLSAGDGGGALTERRFQKLGGRVVKTQASGGVGVGEVFRAGVETVLSSLGPLPENLPPSPRGRPRPVKITAAVGREVDAANEIYLRTFSSTTTSYTPHSEAFLGAILETFDLLSPPQVNEALAIRTKALKGGLDMSLGEVLLKKGYLESEDVERGELLKAASEIIHEEILYGKIALEQKLVPFDKFRKALLFQKNSHFQYALGILLMDAGVIQPSEHMEILKGLEDLHAQEMKAEEDLARGRSTVSIRRSTDTGRKTTMFFGSLAVKNKFITQEQLDEALRIQKKLKAEGTNKYVGVILQEMGYLSPREVDIICSSLEKHLAKNPIEGYKIEALIGRGAMGLVYAAVQLKLDRMVALKVLDPKYAMDQDYISRFYMEAKTAATLNHPNIVQAYDVGESMGYHYFAMEYVEGVTVKQMLEQRGIIEEREALDIVLQIVEALHHAEINNMVHLDIKPSNIMMTSDGVAKLCDLGLAKKIDSRAEDEEESTLIMGSPFYISPEQIEREPELDHRADIYSLGATLYHMVCGQPPFSGNTTREIFLKHLTQRLPDPTDIVPDLAEGTYPLLKKAMQKDREERFQNMEELWNAIRPLAGLQPGSLRTQGIRSFTRRLSRVLRRDAGVE